MDKKRVFGIAELLQRMCLNTKTFVLFVSFVVKTKYLIRIANE